MEWRQQTSFSCADAFNEAQRWIEEVTGKTFVCSNFRAALENGVLLCDLINQLKPGIIKRLNRLSTPIAGLDNVNVFLKACGKLGLNESQLFHPGDLQDLSTRVMLRRDESNRRLKNVLITIYWLGRKAHLDAYYNGPQLNFKAFEGLLGLALSKALDESSNVFMKDSGYTDREEFRRMRLSCKREDSVDSLDSLDSRALRTNSCGSDAEAEQVFRMENTKNSDLQTKGHLPPPLVRRKREQEESGRSCSSPFASDDVPSPPPPHLTLSSPEWDVDEELFLRALYEEDSEDDYTEADPVLDDLYARRVQQTLHQTSTNPNYDRFLPRYWTPEEETRVRTIYLGSQRRPWYRKMQGLRSKSLSDIPMGYPVRTVSDGNTIIDVDQESGSAKKWNQEKKCKSQAVAKDTEAQWQDDLTKWKSRRRSTKSDLRRKSQDREHVISQMTNGAVTDSDFHLLRRDQVSPRRHNPTPRPFPISPSKSSSPHFWPHTPRAVRARSYATEESSGETMPAADGNILGEETHYASLATNGAGVTTPSLDCPFSSLTQVKAQSGSAPVQSVNIVVQPENVFADQISSQVTRMLSSETKSNGIRDPPAAASAQMELPFCVDPKAPTYHPDAGDPLIVDALVDFSSKKQVSQLEGQNASREPAVVQGRGQQAAGNYKYLTRTASWSSSASLPRGFRRSDGSSRLSSVITARPFGTKQSRVSSLPRLCKVEDNQGLLKCEKESSFSPPTSSFLKRQTATCQLTCQYQAAIRPKKANNAKQTVSELGKEGKSASPSCQTFQTHGHHNQPHTQTPLLSQSYSNLQSQHNKSLAVPSNTSSDLPKVDHSDMRVCLTLKPNSRPDFGFQTHWDSTGARVKFIQPGSPAELCRLCMADEIVAVNGDTVAQMSYNQWENKMKSALQTGSLTMDIRRYGNKDWSISEASHHNQPGQSRVTLNLTSAAPVLIGCSDHHANSAASTEKVKQVMDGELVDCHKTASKGGSESAISDLQVPSLSPSSSSWSWDSEDYLSRQEKWQEDQQRLLQERYQRDQQRLEAEWQRAQRDAMVVETNFEGTNSGENPAGGLHVTESTTKNRQEERSPEREEHQETQSKPQNDKRVPNDEMTQQDWVEGSCGLAQLSPAHRAKSLSTPALAGPHKPPTGDQRKKKGEGVSKAQQDRQQILEEMKKRTQLLTDNSWIRQRSSSFYKEPIYVGAPMKRYESLDDIDRLHHSPLSPARFSYPRPLSAATGYCAPSGNYSSRYSTGAVLSKRDTSTDSSHASVWAASEISEEMRLESRF